MTNCGLQSLDRYKYAYQRRIDHCEHVEKREQNSEPFYLLVLDEVIYAAGADRVILCGGRTTSVSLAEEHLPRIICPLIKSSFGSVVSKKRCGAAEAYPHFDVVDTVVAETTCDGKKKMYELLDHYIPTYVIDLPQKPESPEALHCYRGDWKYFLPSFFGDY